MNAFTAFSCYKPQTPRDKRPWKYARLVILKKSTGHDTCPPVCGRTCKTWHYFI